MLHVTSAPCVARDLHTIAPVATSVYVLETVRGAVKRLSKISICACECDYYLYSSSSSSSYYYYYCQKSRSAPVNTIIIYILLLLLLLLIIIIIVKNLELRL